ncbi:MAG: tetratricopeptide repeat protein [Candidatus Cloacimonetes bacterium]|nr:tetratricopeptide repeat protein [Candidatus Cloacimonadota bacterium]
MSLFSDLFKNSRQILEDENRIVKDITLLIHLKKFDDAIDRVTQFLQEYPDSITGLIILARVYSKTGNYKRALDLLINNPTANKNKDAILEMAKIHYVNNELEMSEKYFLKVIALDENNYDALNGLSDIYEQKGNENKSINYLKKALNKNSINEGWIKLSHKYKKSGNDDEAIKALKHVNFYTQKDEKSNFKNAEKELRLGELYEKKKEYKIARNHYETSIKFISNQPEIYYRLAKIYTRLAEFDLALENYKKAAKLGHKICQKHLMEQKIPWRD